MMTQRGVTLPVIPRSPRTAEAPQRVSARSIRPLHLFRCRRRLHPIPCDTAGNQELEANNIVPFPSESEQEDWSLATIALKDDEGESTKCVAIDGVAKPPHFAVGMARSLIASQLECFISKECGPSKELNARARNYASVLQEISSIDPSFNRVFARISQFLCGICGDYCTLRHTLHQQVDQHVQVIAKQKDEFCRTAVTQVLLEKRQLADTIAQLHAQINVLLQDRDAELKSAKNDVESVIQQYDRDTAQKEELRHLVHTVFQANGELQRQIELLQQQTGHRIFPAIASPRSEDFGQSSSLMPTRQTSQTPWEFVAANIHELNLCRMSTQRALIDAAMDSRSASKAVLEVANKEKQNLKNKIAQQENIIEDLEQRIHEGRFFPETKCAVESSDEIPGEVSRRCFTPRPRIPFAVQLQLGISLTESSRNICESLSQCALRLDGELRAARERSRRLSAATEWLNERSLHAITDEQCHTPYIQVVPSSEWAKTHHFLRSRIEQSVINEGWTKTRTSHMIFMFFERLQSLREEAATFHDDKCCAPPKLQVWERDESSFILVDRPQHQQAIDADVPKGYYVTIFLNRLLQQAIDADDAPKAHSYHASVDPLAFTTMAYNLWHSAKFYRRVEPLCDLFVRVLDGQLPEEVYKISSAQVTDARRRLQSVDVVHTGSLFYGQIMDTLEPIWGENSPMVFKHELGAAVAGTMRIHHTLTDPVAIEDLSLCEEHPEGASLLVRTIRRGIQQAYLDFYSLLIDALEPLVFESTAIRGLFVLRVKEAEETALDLDENLSVPIRATLPCNVLFAGTLVAALTSVTRLNSSVHAFVPNPIPTSTTATPPRKSPARSPTTRSDQSRRRRMNNGSGRTPQKTPDALALVTNDQELAEWHELCSVIRRRMPVLVSVQQIEQQPQVQCADEGAA